MEDREKIEAKIRELNGGLDTGPWDEAKDFSMMPAIRSDTNGKYTIYADDGVAFKVFVNTETGETQMFWADIFMKGR